MPNPNLVDAAGRLADDHDGHPHEGHPLDSRPPVYASMWRRFIAYALDGVIGVTLMYSVLWSPIAAKSDHRLLGVEFFIAVWLYSAMMESAPWQATLGKLALGIKVATVAGERVSFTRASVRFAAHLLNYFTAFIGYVMAGFTQRRQGLHDIVARTVVVRRRYTASDIAHSPPGTGWEGVVLLLPFLLAVAKVTSIAIPSYQDHVIREQIKDGLQLAQAVKRATGKYYEDYDEWPSGVTGGDDALDFDVSPTDGYVSAVELSAPGVVTITYGNRAHARIAGTQLSLNAVLTRAGRVAWFCGDQGLTTPGDGFVKVGEGPTSVPNRYLPYDCRDLRNIDADHGVPP